VRAEGAGGAAVVEEHREVVALRAGHNQIKIIIVIQVADGDSHGIQARAVGHARGKRAAAVVQQNVHGVGSGIGRCEVEIAIVVEIARAHERG
jgi:hypothetical protein